MAPARVRASGMQVITAKDGKGSAIMAPAFAAASFTSSLLKALNGEAVTEYAYVASSVTDAPFFASKVQLGPNGVEKVFPVEDVSPGEQKDVESAVRLIKEDVAKGIAFMSTR
ncbi:unnamed protein product [Closterium sp. NIES-54]